MKIKDWIIQEQEKHFCKCGCGNTIPIKPWHHSAGIPDYLQGHQTKANPPNYKPENHTFRECECGCGELVTGAKNGKLIRFKHGHWARINNSMESNESIAKVTGINNHNYVPVGSKRVNDHKKYKYCLIKVTDNEWEYEHRMIAEKNIGRPLLSNEIAHHINKDTLDNRPENIAVLTLSDHSKLHCQFDNAPRREFLNGKVTIAKEVEKK